MIQDCSWQANTIGSQSVVWVYNDSVIQQDDLAHPVCSHQGFDTQLQVFETSNTRPCSWCYVEILQVRSKWHSRVESPTPPLKNEPKSVVIEYVARRKVPSLYLSRPVFISGRALWRFTVFHLWKHQHINSSDPHTQPQCFTLELQTDMHGCPNNDRLIQPFSTIFCLKTSHRLGPWRWRVSTFFKPHNKDLYYSTLKG